MSATPPPSRTTASGCATSRARATTTRTRSTATPPSTALWSRCTRRWAAATACAPPASRSSRPPLKNKFVGILALGVFSLLIGFVFSCKKEKDPCEGITCQNGGSCNEGTCSCPANTTGTNCENCKTGYEGSGCSTVSRDKVIGNYWSTNGGCNNGATNSYTAKISAIGSTDQIAIYNLSGYGSNIYVTGSITGNNITIPSQSVSGATYSGTGVYNASTKKITFNYSISTGSGAITCTSTIYAKQ